MGADFEAIPEVEKELYTFDLEGNFYADQAAFEADLESLIKDIEQLESLLPHFNWRSHIFLISDFEPGQAEALRTVINALARFVEHNAFVTLFVHPLLCIGSRDVAQNRLLGSLLNDIRPLQLSVMQPALSCLRDTRLPGRSPTVAAGVREVGSLQRMLGRSLSAAECVVSCFCRKWCPGHDSPSLVRKTPPRVDRPSTCAESVATDSTR